MYREAFNSVRLGNLATIVKQIYMKIDWGMIKKFKKKINKMSFNVNPFLFSPNKKRKFIRDLPFLSLLFHHTFTLPLTLSSHHKPKLTPK